MNVKSICLAVALALPAGVAAAAPAPTELEAARVWYWQHPYQPEAINRLALQLAKAGDAGGAAVLLERALRIAPDRQDIRANLQRLQAGSRRVADAEATEPAVPPASAGADAPQPDLPAPWPLPAAAP